MLLADTVAVVHGAAVVLMLTGAVVALWRPRVLWVHLPVSLAILAVNRAGAPCPLTEVELWLRAEAGHAAYEGGYLGHYVLSPMGLDVASPSAQAGIYTVAIVPNALAFGLLAARALRFRGSSRASGVLQNP
ncbi:MAG: DUF2784 domain-containing protein [Blastococcus sp.]